MRTHYLLAVVLMLVPAALHAQRPRDYEPDLKGYVTQITSPTVIDVNGTHIRIDGNTQFFTKTKSLTRIAAADLKPYYIGQPLQVYGHSHKQENAMLATQINLVQRKPSEVEGYGVVDAVLDSPTPGESMLHADGYILRIPAACELTFKPPLTSSADLHTNVWITFRGSQSWDGTVTVSKLSVRENIIGGSEERQREKTEHDPATVDPNAKQSATSQYFAGIDPRQIPPSKDAVMQARIEAIGNKLIPNYQSELLDSDPTKINFRFQLIDEPKWFGVFAWPNGIILIPHAAVDSLQNDSQIAAVLAFDIATVLEKQSQHLLPMNHKLLPFQAGALATELLVPVVGAPIGLAALATLQGNTGDVVRHATEKSSRVSLGLMYDAGFDLYQAPRAWWLLSDFKGKGLDKIPLPFTSEYLYKFLGETWHAQ